MSARIVRVFVVSFCAFLFLSACTSTVSRQRYDQDVQTLKDDRDALERRNSDLEAQVSGMEKTLRESEIVSRQNEFYDQIAKQMQEWLQSSQIGSADVSFDPRTGKWSMAGDVLFESGSYSLTTKGREILKTFAGAYASRNVRLRVVGHTDRDPVAKPTTKSALPVTHALNLELSVLRAVAVAYELHKNGIAENRMFIEGQGNNSPVSPNDRNPENKRKNRRVEIFVIGLAPEAAPANSGSK